MDRYQFTNFTQYPFTGRFGGVNYPFAPLETKEFDPDKHYMLILMSKQLADRELQKGMRGVGKNPNDLERFGKSLDENGNLYVITPDNRKELMRKAIGSLLDKPVPIPEVQTEEAGATQQVSENVKNLQQEIKDLKDLVTTFISKKETAVPNGQPKDVPIIHSEPSEPSMVMTREALESLAKDKNIANYQTMSKTQLIEAIAV